MGQYECSVCGHDVAPGANYCEKCGARLNWTEHLPFAPDDEKNVKQSYPAQQRIILQRERPYYEVASQKELIGTFRKIAIGLLIFVIVLALVVFAIIIAAISG